MVFLETEGYQLDSLDRIRILSKAFSMLAKILRKKN
jgi:hypothetical protein